MRVIVTETTVVSYQVDVPQEAKPVEAARIARTAFRRALDPTIFRHSVAQNSVEYTVLGREVPQTFIDDQLE